MFQEMGPCQKGFLCSKGSNINSLIFHLSTLTLCFLNPELPPVIPALQLTSIVKSSQSTMVFSYLLCKYHSRAIGVCVCVCVCVCVRACVNLWMNLRALWYHWVLSCISLLEGIEKGWFQAGRLRRKLNFVLRTIRRTEILFNYFDEYLNSCSTFILPFEFFIYYTYFYISACMYPGQGL